MSNQVAKVVKSEHVKVSGSVTLGPSLSGGWLGLNPVRRPVPSSSEPAAAGVPQEVRIIESNNEYAIIEVTCSCGAKSHIQCNYADMTKE